MNIYMSRPDSHLDKARLDNLAEEIWKSAERLRGKFKAHGWCYRFVVAGRSSLLG